MNSKPDPCYLPLLWRGTQKIMQSAIRDLINPHKRVIMTLCVDRRTAEDFIMLNQRPVHGAN